MKRFLIIWGYLLSSMLLLALVGCGGGNGGEQAGTGGESASETGPIETTVTESPRSKSDYIQLANGICKRINASRTPEILQYAQEHKGEGVSEAELGIKAYRAVTIPRIPTQIEELRALGAPKGDKQQIEAVLASMKRILKTPDRFLLREVERTGELARAYGIGRCIY